MAKFNYSKIVIDKAYSKISYLSEGLNRKQIDLLIKLCIKGMDIHNIETIKNIGIETGIWLYDVPVIITQERLDLLRLAIDDLGSMLKHKTPKITMAMINARIDGYNKDQIKVLYKIYKTKVSVSNSIDPSTSVDTLKKILELIYAGYDASAKIDNIMYAIRNNIDWEDYITPKLSEDKIMCVINGLIDGVDVTQYNNYKFSLDKMVAIKNVLKGNLDPTPLLECKDDFITIMHIEHKILFGDEMQIKYAYENLANAIIEQAAKDYRKGLTHVALDDDALSAKRFLNSKHINNLTGISGKYIIHKLDEENRHNKKLNKSSNKAGI